MRWIRQLAYRASSQFRRRKLEADMAEEMRLHLEHLTEKGMGAGASLDEARHAAQRQFGGIDQFKEESRDRMGWRWLGNLASDIRYAARILRKTPVFTAVGVLTVALGVGITTTTFSYLRTTIFRSLPFASPDALVTFVGPQSPADLLDIKARNEVFTSFAILDFPSYSASLPGLKPERISAFAVGGEFFAAMGIPPLLGRTFRAEEDHEGRDHVVVLSYQYWMKRLAGDPAVVGKSLRLDGEAYEVIGVMPEKFNIPTIWGVHDLWKPLAMVHDIQGVRYSTWLYAVARLRADTPLSKAQANLNAIGDRLEREHPDTNLHRRFPLSKLGRPNPGRERQFYLLIAGLSVSVLAIACANLANLQLARGTARCRELATRVALGASRSRIISQMLTESLLLSFTGGALGVAGAWGGNRLLSLKLASAFQRQPFLISPDALQSPFDLQIDGRVIVFALCAAVITGALFGIAPAWMASRVDINTNLKQASGRATGNRSRHQLRRLLLISELSLTLVLLAGAAYFSNGFRRLAHRELGWRPDHLLTARIVLPYNRYGTNALCVAFFDGLSRELAAVPGIKSSALCDSLPTYGFFNSIVLPVDGDVPGTAEHSPRVYLNPVYPGYFDTLGTKLILGRDFTAADRRNAQFVVIIDKELADQLWPNQNPIGRRLFRHKENPLGIEVIGVVSEEVFSLEPYPLTHMQLFQCLLQTSGNYLNLAVRTTIDPDALIEEVRKAVFRVDPDLAIFRIESAEKVAMQSSESDSILTGSLIFLAASGLLLSAIGLYGVVSNLVIERTSEIGIRMALGAQIRDVMWIVLGEAVRLALTGLLAGVLGAWVLARVLAAYMPGVIGQDPASVAGCALLLLGITLLACWLPARRAARIDPIQALRAD
jgi:putative ABC transport system permease protein